GLEAGRRPIPRADAIGARARGGPAGRQDQPPAPVPALDQDSLRIVGEPPQQELRHQTPRRLLRPRHLCARRKAPPAPAIRSAGPTASPPPAPASRRVSRRRRPSPAPPPPG